MYNITDYSKRQAKKLNVEIKPSSKKNKKIDIIKNNKVIASIGDILNIMITRHILKKKDKSMQMKGDVYIK